MMLEPKSFLRNFWLKFFSIALATVIWLGIHSSIQNQLSFSHVNFNSIRLPVGVVTAEGDHRTFKVTPNEVVAFAIADSRALSRGLRVYVDLTQFAGGKNTAQELHIEAPAEWRAFTTPQTVSVEEVGK
jgi:hypothetical protein